MTLYEVEDLINSIGSNIIAGQAVFLTVITGYMIVAYTVGKSLTRYQVGFINLILIIANISGFMGVFANTTMIYEYSAIRAELTGGQKIREEFSAAWIISSTSPRALLIGGALLFMWQVRHPKTE